MGYKDARSLPEAVKRKIRQSAIALRDYAASEAKMRVSLCDNIASDQFVHDEHGWKLNEIFFGWADSTDRWWEAKGVTFFSPVTIGARYECEPFWCNRAGFHQETPNPALSSLDLSKIEYYTGRKAAIVVPVHLPFGRIAAVTFHPDDRELEDLSEVFAQHAQELERLSRALVICFVKGIDALPRGAYSLLNPREIECLQWAAGGKTDNEIAQIIARSHATIRFHMRSAMDKLNSVNRSQAIFRAGQLGYLSAVH